MNCKRHCELCAYNCGRGYVITMHYAEIVMENQDVHFSRDLTDVTLLSEDAFWRLDSCDSGDKACLLKT